MLPVWFVVGSWAGITIFEQRGVGRLTLQSVQRLINEQISPDGAFVITDAWTYDDLYAVSQGDRWRILDMNLESADEFSRLWQNEPERLVQVLVVLTRERTGLMADTRRFVRDRVTLAPFTSRTLSPQEAAAIRDATVDHLVRDHPELVPQAWSGRIGALRSSDVDEASTVWWGYAVDAAAVVGTAMTGVTLVGVLGGAVEAGRRARERRRGRRGLCPACGYSLAGVDGSVCPECGARIVGGS